MIINGLYCEYKKLYRYVEICRALIHKPVSTFKHFAILVDKSRIISIGFNDISRPTDLVKFPLGGRHAEPDAIANLDDLNIIRKCNLISIRLNPRGELRLAKPCDICHTFLVKMGIKKIYYSTEFGFNYMDLRS